MRKTVYCANNYLGYASWLLPMGIKIVHNPNQADILLLEGGQDIDYRFYSSRRGRCTGSPSKRDELEFELYSQFNKEKKCVLGICRGAQLICALQPGGALIQDMDHPGRHDITTNTGEVISIVSLHHQMQFLDNIVDKDSYKLLAWANRLSKYHYDGDDKDMNLPDDYKEPEVVIYHGNQIAIQSHPEMMSQSSEFVQYCQNLVREYFFNEKPVPYSSSIPEGIGRENKIRRRERLEIDYDYI